MNILATLAIVRLYNYILLGLYEEFDILVEGFIYKKTSNQYNLLSGGHVCILWSFYKGKLHLIISNFYASILSCWVSEVQNSSTSVRWLEQKIHMTFLQHYINI